VIECELVESMTKPRLKRCPWCLSAKTLALKPQERGGFAVQCLECKVTVFAGDACGMAAPLANWPRQRRNNARGRRSGLTNNGVWAGAPAEIHSPAPSPVKRAPAGAKA
jgi:hypothetical protein